MEALKLRGSDMLILAASWIFLMASGELSTLCHMFHKQMMATTEKMLSGEVRSLHALGGFLGTAWNGLGRPWVSLGVLLG